MASGFTLGNTIPKRMDLPPRFLSFLFYLTFTTGRTVTWDMFWDVQVRDATSGHFKR